MLDPILIKEIISDFHEREIPVYTRRMFDLSCPESKIRCLMGIRRSGKTFTFYQLIADLLKQGVEKERILFINFEDERLLPLDVSDFSTILNAYYEMYPAFKEKRSSYSLTRFKISPIGSDLFAESTIQKMSR